MNVPLSSPVQCYYKVYIVLMNIFIEHFNVIYNVEKLEADKEIHSGIINNLIRLFQVDRFFFFISFFSRHLLDYRFRERLTCIQNPSFFSFFLRSDFRFQITDPSLHRLFSFSESFKSRSYVYFYFFHFTYNDQFLN